MKLHKSLVLLVFGFIIFNADVIFGQTAKDAADLKGLIYEQQKPEQQEVTLLAPDIETYIANQVFIFYKKYISSQDGDVCTFYPSCSAYALQAVKKDGFLLGMINAMDRLTRCNGLNNHKYEIHSHSGKLHDPVK